MTRLISTNIDGVSDYPAFLGDAVAPILPLLLIPTDIGVAQDEYGPREVFRPSSTDLHGSPASIACYPDHDDLSVAERYPPVIRMLTLSADRTWFVRSLASRY